MWLLFSLHQHHWQQVLHHEKVTNDSGVFRCPSGCNQPLCCSKRLLLAVWQEGEDSAGDLAQCHAGAFITSTARTRLGSRNILCCQQHFWPVQMSTRAENSNLRCHTDLPKVHIYYKLHTSYIITTVFLLGGTDWQVSFSSSSEKVLLPYDIATEKNHI